MKVIDLTHTLYDGMECYPSDPPIVFKKKKDIDSDRSIVHEVTFGTHTGTHLDAPRHINKEGKSITDFNIDSFFGRAIKVDSTNYQLLSNKKDSFDVVIFDTEWYKNFNCPDIYFGQDRPIIPIDLIEICIKNKIKIFGCDLPSVDKSGIVDKINHQLLLSNDILIYESLANLNKIKVLKEFMFYGFPLALNNLDGCLVRAVGILE